MLLAPWDWIVARHSLLFRRFPSVFAYDFVFSFRGFVLFSDFHFVRIVISIRIGLSSTPV